MVGQTRIKMKETDQHWSQICKAAGKTGKRKTSKVLETANVSSLCGKMTGNMLENIDTKHIRDANELASKKGSIPMHGGGPVNKGTGETNEVGAVNQNWWEKQKTISVRHDTEGNNLQNKMGNDKIKNQDTRQVSDSVFEIVTVNLTVSDICSTD